MMITEGEVLGQLTMTEKFPGMNDIITASEKHWSVYSKMKAKYTKIVEMAAIRGNVRSVSINGRVLVVIDWHEPKNSRRDPDNVFAAKKFVFDGLVDAMVMPNDGKKWVAGARDNISFNRPEKAWAVVVTILEVAE